MIFWNRKPRTPSLRFLAVALVGAWAFFPILASHAQSVSSSSPSPSAQPSNPQTPAVNSPKPGRPPKPRHIITNEDLEPRATANPDDEKYIPGENAMLLRCDSSCEQAARNELGFDADNEAAWRIQVLKAREDLAGDHVWRGMLNQAIQQSDTYCNFLLQQSQKTGPSGNDYRSQVLRARSAQYFENMDRALRQNIQTTVNRMQQHIKEVQVLSPVRGAMMYVQSSRIFERTCDPPGAR